MLSAFQLENNRLTRLEAEESQPLIDAVWVDLVEPDDDERLRVQSELGQSLATRPELEDIEASARFFEDDDGLHIHSFFFFEDAEDHAGNSTVAFTIREGRLFTLREREGGVWKVSMRATNPADASVVCAKFGGGGHKGAAGCSLTGELEDVKARVVAACGEAIKALENK